jgi:hypothetical protein
MLPMAHPSAPERRDRTPRRAFYLLQSAAMLTLIPFAAGAQTLSTRLVPSLGQKSALLAAGLSPASIPGFRRLGSSLVGTVRTEDGASIRLVFDARSLALIGMKQIEAPPGPARGCISLSSELPLPPKVPPASAVSSLISTASAVHRPSNAPTPLGIPTSLPNRATPAN